MFAGLTGNEWPSPGLHTYNVRPNATQTMVNQKPTRWQIQLFPPAPRPEKREGGERERERGCKGNGKHARPTPRHEPFGPFPLPSKHLSEVPSARTEVIDVVAPRGGREPLALLVGEVVRLQAALALKGTLGVGVAVAVASIASGRCGTGRGGGRGGRGG